MKRKVIISILSMVMILSICVGCGTTKKLTQQEYNTLKESVTLGCGLTVSEMDQMMLNFIYKVYTPNNQADIIAGIDSLKKFLTDEEYNSLKVGMSDYKKDTNPEVSNIHVRICKGEYSNDSMDRVLIAFTIKTGGYARDMLLEFVLNPNNKIFKHYIWTTKITQK